MIAFLSELITAQLGIVSRPNWERVLPHALEKIGRQRGWNPEQTLQSLEHDPELLTELAGQLMVNETHFMRHPAHFRYLSSFVEEQLRTNALRGVSVWSAGCSTGEEPYSVLLALSNRLSQDELRRVRVLATDISRTAIARARRAEYGAWSFRGTPPHLIDRHFEPVAESKGSFRLRTEMSRQVDFQCASLESAVQKMTDWSLDVVLFRNVAIYLDEGSWRQLYRGFARVLRPGGLLIVAPSDPRPESGLFAKVEDESHCIYRVKSPQFDNPAEGSPRAEGRRKTEAPSPRPSSSIASPRAARRPPSPAPAGSAPKPAPTASATREEPPTDHPLLDAVSRLGDSGDWRGALHSATRLLEAHPRSSRAYFLRGVVHLSASNLEEAVQDFRSALLIAPTDKITRFWFASALHRAGHGRRALAELSTLEGELERLPERALLEDGETTATELLDALNLIKEALL